MKLHQRIRLTATWILSLGLLAAGGLCAKAQLQSNFEWVSLSIQSTGSISYFVHTTKIDLPYAIIPSPVGNPVGRDGTNLFVVMYLVVDGEIATNIYVPGYRFLTNATVLGNLPAGNYGLSCMVNEYGWWSFPTYTLFEVPAPDPTLTTTRSGNNLQIGVRGVTAAKYVVQSSGDLTNWTSVHTNIGAPFAYSITMSNAPLELFRVQVESGMIEGPTVPVGDPW